MIKPGYTRDYTYAPSLKGAATREVAFRVNHTAKTMNSGVSQNYIGESKDAGFKHRVENPYDDKLQDKFGVKTSTSYKKRRLMPSEVDAEMLEGEDKKDTRARQRAASFGQNPRSAHSSPNPKHYLESSTFGKSRVYHGDAGGEDKKDTKARQRAQTRLGGIPLRA